MIVEVQFLDVFDAKRLVPASDLAVISVLGAKEEGGRPSFDGFVPDRVLRLQFDDVVYPMSEEHLTCGPTMDRARVIHGFVEALHRSEAPVRLVAHCFGGVSRSAAIALHAASIAGLVPLQVQARSDAAAAANDRLLGMLRSVATGEAVDLPRTDFSHPDSFIGARCL